MARTWRTAPIPLFETMAHGMDLARNSISSSWMRGNGLMSGLPCVLYNERYSRRNCSKSAASSAGPLDDAAAGYSCAMVLGSESPAAIDAAMAASDGDGTLAGRR